MHQIRSMPISAEADIDRHSAQTPGLSSKTHDLHAETESEPAGSSAAGKTRNGLSGTPSTHADAGNRAGCSRTEQSPAGTEEQEIDWSAALEVSADANDGDAEAGMEGADLQGDIDWDIDLADVEVLEGDADAEEVPDTGELMCHPELCVLMHSALYQASTSCYNTRWLGPKQAVTSHVSIVHKTGKTPCYSWLKQLKWQKIPGNLGRCRSMTLLFQDTTYV